MMSELSTARSIASRGPDWRLRLLALAAVAVLLTLPTLTTGYTLGIVSEIFIFAIFAISLDLLIGHTGLFSFGHASFFGLSAYTVVLLGVHFGIGAWAGLAAGIVVSAIGAVVIGFFCIRVSGIPFLMLTLAFSQLLLSVAVKWRDVTGGTDGIGGLAKPSIFGVSLENQTAMYLVSLVAFIGVVWGMKRLLGSPLGSVFIGIRENEARMAAVGYPVARYKLLSFTIAGAIAGLGGGLYGIFTGFISSDVFLWSISGDAIVMIILGGTGTLLGPAVGAAIFLLMKNVVSSHSEHWMLVIGSVFILCVMLLREGVVGWLQQRLRRREDL